LRFVRSVDDLRAIVRTATTEGRSVRVAGAGHSHFPLVPTDGVIVDVSALSGLLAVDREAGTARVMAGTPVHVLGPALHAVGMALPNQGDIDRQAIGGAVATGTHGTGRSLRNLAAGVLGMSMVTADGEILDGGPGDDWFSAARIGLGAFGIVTELTIAVRPAYRLRERGWSLPYDELRPTIDELARTHRHFEFFWYPRRDLAIAKAIDETDDPAVYPLGDEGRRVAWSHEVLPNHRPNLHTEMEIAVPVDRSLDCLDEIRTLVLDRFPDLRWPIEYRTIAADDVWLSQADGRDVATISVHQGVELDDEPLFRACETVFRRYDGRPHWGKVHYFDGRDLAGVHPAWTAWWRERDALDPAGTFLNAPLRAWRP
jgi:FAD/FMN-containing dehydrogenase